MPGSTAIILTNLGTADHLDRASVKRFLDQFLSDPGVVEVPRPIWWLLLNLLILPFRSGKTLEGYRCVWTDEGSPLLAISRKQQTALQAMLGEDIKVVLAMRYGNPAYKNVVSDLLSKGVTRLIVLPLYPQNAATTTATSFYHLADVLASRRDIPSVYFIDNYHDNPAYIEVLAMSVKKHWSSNSPDRHLLISFHGLPPVNVDRGDPYYDQCQNTASLLTEALELDKDQWSLGFQSRFGKQVWLKPYTSDVLEGLIEKGVTDVDVICPGFSADCLETLDEIEVEYRKEFVDKGGKQFHYIPALNDSPTHIEMMASLVKPYL
jgi:protoporphyrin/coproporphyrin ferrochelatase